MGECLWDWAELVTATAGVSDGTPARAINGVSIDSRDLSPGDLFVALKDQRDGHEFVPAAFQAGAGAALVSHGYARKDDDGALIRVPDVLRGLEAAGVSRRGMLSRDARVVAVTGSAGKTSTKEMLKACLDLAGPTHAAQKSFNNHWGVPLTLVRMPRETRYGVFEIGMNHAGEIRPLTRMVRPHVAIITTVAPVHIGHFASEEDIADAKAEILEGIEPGGVAILNRDNRHFDRLRARAGTLGVEVVSFGISEGADVRPDKFELDAEGSTVHLRLGGALKTYRVGAPGLHMMMNSLAVAATLDRLGVALDEVLVGLQSFAAPVGRGARRVIDVPGGKLMVVDESYNANPASVTAALQALSLVPRSEFPRRIAVLGDMLELGERSVELHVSLKQAIDEAGVDLVFACGPNMCALFHTLAPRQRGLWADTAAGITQTVVDLLRAGDAVMVKGSLGSRMAPVVAEILGRYQGD